MKKAIKHQWFFNHPPEVVWDYLTDAKLLAQWLMKNDFQPVVGHSFQFTTRAMPDFDFDGHVYCRVLEIEPLKKLSYSWKGGPDKDTITLDTVVVWRLEAKDNGTQLLLEHTGFDDNVNMGIYAIMDQGWLKNMKEIGELINAKQYGHNKA